MTDKNEKKNKPNTTNKKAVNGNGNGHAMKMTTKTAKPKATKGIMANRPNKTNKPTKTNTPAKKQLPTEYFIAIDPTGSPVTSTLRAKKDKCLSVLCQGQSARWNQYQKDGYKVRSVKLMSEGKQI